jgi:PKD repeat protein
MPEEKVDGIKRTVAGWIKAALTSVVGLVSGALLMYLTPLVNNAIKPAKPLANFAAQANGLTVNFSNRSTGATQGWWDFGDGTALEPFDPKLEIVAHKYDKPGTYSVKLSLLNLIGEESDRTVPVTLDTDSAVAAPEIADFKLDAITRDERAPAAYRLTGKLKPGGKCILSYGDDRPLEFFDSSTNVDRLVYFQEMGAYTVRLAAFNGKQLVEKAQTVFVAPSESSDPLAKLLVTYQAVHIDRAEKTFHIHCAWQADVKDGVCAFRKERLADPDCKIVSAELVGATDPNCPVRNARVAVADDKSKFILTGELTKKTGIFAPRATAPHWLAAVKVVMERRSAPQTQTPGAAMVNIKPGVATKIPMQPLGADWQIIGQQVSLELWDGSRKVWEGNQAVTSAPVTLNNHRCFVTAVPQNDGFVVRIDDPSATTFPPLAPPPIVAPQAAPVVAAPPRPQFGPIRKVGYEFDPRNPLPR